MIPRPSAAVRIRSVHVELGLAEELVAAAVLQAGRATRRSTPTVAEESAADPGQVGLARVGGEEREQRAQVGQVEQRQALGWSA